MKCIHCDYIIELPYSHLPQTDAKGVTLVKGEDPPELPEDEWNAVFGCMQCGTVNAYHDWDVRTEPIPKSEEGIYQSGKGVFRVEFPCANTHCKSLASVHVDIGARSIAEAIKELRSDKFFYALPCGHDSAPVPESLYRFHPVLKRMW